MRQMPSSLMESLFEMKTKLADLEVTFLEESKAKKVLLAWRAFLEAVQGLAAQIWKEYYAGTVAK